MTYKQYIRNVKLNDLGIEPLAGDYLKIHNFLNNNFISKNRYDYKDKIFIGKDEYDFYLEYNKNYKSLWISKSKIWDFFRKETNMGYLECKSFIKGCFSYILDLDVFEIYFVSDEIFYSTSNKTKTKIKY